MEVITVNLVVGNAIAKARREWRDGREWIVAPLTTIVPGVLNGSKGSLYYPPEEVARSASAWNGVPLVLQHPSDPLSGRHQSAREPGVLERSGLGEVRATTFNGKLRHEGWFDVERTKLVAPGVLKSLTDGQPIELSTGLYTDNHPAPAGSTHGGRPYQFIARNYRPDHMAILPDQVGACSIQDGCGVLVNARNAEMKNLDKRTVWNKLGELLGLSHPAVVNRKRGECPRCGGEVDEDGECEECGYVENASACTCGGGVRDGHCLKCGGVSANAGINQPRHAEKGHYQAYDAGVGKGPVHAAAKDGRGAVEVSKEADADPQPKDSVHGEVDPSDDRSAGKLFKGPIQNDGGDDVVMANEVLTNAELGRDAAFTSDAARLYAFAYATVHPSKLTTRNEFASDDQRRAFFGLKAEHGAGGKADQRKASEASEKEKLGKDKPVGGGGKAAEGSEKSGHELSKEAVKRSGIASKVNKDRQAGEHDKAAKAHEAAAIAHIKEGDKEKTDIHFAAAKEHAAKAHSLRASSMGKELAGNELLVDEMVANGCLCSTKRDAALRTLNAKAEGSNADESADVATKARMKSKEEEEDGGDEIASADENFVKGKPMTSNQWMEMAPPEVRETLHWARQITDNQKQQMVTRLTANIADPARRQVVADGLMSKSLQELTDRLELLPQTANNSDGGRGQSPVWLGAAAPTANQGMSDAERNDILPLPTINWQEDARLPERLVGGRA